MTELSASERKLLRAMRDGEKASPEKLLELSGLDSLQEVMSSAGWLQIKGLVKIDERVKKIISLDEEGKRYHDEGLPERRALSAIHAGAATIDEVAQRAGLEKKEISIAVGWLKKKNWATIGKTIALTEKGEKALTTKEKDEDALAALFTGEVSEESLDAEALEMLKSRQNILKEREIIHREIALTEGGKKAAADVEDEGGEAEVISQLTPGLIQKVMSDTTRYTLKKYDVNMPVAQVYGGKAHPLRQIIEEIRRVFLDMGFTEISGNFVESCFWDMDALFVPQDHPAREMQDTFYLKEPKKIEITDTALVKKIKEVHENGGDTGSVGWGSSWSRGEAERALLRTHTTINTIRYLSEHPEPPVKVFCVGRVFRKEAIDFSHLPEFYQVEGILMEENANLRMLIGLLTEFYHKMGFKKVRVRPSYFPYTEPSLEVETYFEDRNKWLELGGAGIYRPEVTAPFNVKHPVLAWGLGLERLAILRLGLKDIRDLYISDINWLRKTPLL